MAQPNLTCERCGAPALVHIGHDPEYGNVIRHFCLDCADIADMERLHPARPLNHAAIAIAVGTIVLLLSVFADVLKFGHAGGFGWKQDLGVIIGVCLAGIGATFHISTLFIIGLHAIALSLLANWMQFGHGDGFGPNQLLGTVVGTVLILVGLVWSRRKRANGPRSASGSPGLA
jgi:hypothetical protein